MTGKRVLILVMPFVPLERPALGPGLLKQALRGRGIPCDVRFFNFRLADLIGFQLHQRIAYSTPTHDLVGEWIFTKALHGREALPADRFRRYASLTSTKYYDASFFAQIEYCRDAAVDFVRECADSVDLEQYDIAGFSTTFQQNIASLALAKQLKLRAPRLQIIFGGANCEGEMGLELHRSFPFVDFVCSGESDYLLPDLVAAIRQALPLGALGGLVYRENGRTVQASAPQTMVEDMDSLPVPDHSDFLEAFHSSTASIFIKPQLTMETSRGCWWGQKHHCTFCGLNGLTMKYRSKSVDRAFDEIRQLIDTYGIRSFFNTDNIVDMRYFSTLFPRLQQQGVRVQLCYETKSNLKKSQLVALKRSGSDWVQPGIENLSSRVLEIMDKGVKGIHNVQMLKWARSLGIKVTWNVICGFPGEQAEDYRGMTRVIRSIPHLPPPASFSRFRLDRFSPMFDHPERFGLANARPFESYHLCYGLREDSVRRIAYFYCCESPADEETTLAIREAWHAAMEWKQNANKGTLIGVVSGEFLLLLDSRPNHPSREYLLAGKRRAVYLAADAASSIRRLVPALRTGHPEFEWSEQEVLEILTEFEDLDLLLREGNLYMGLALLPVEENESTEADFPPEIAPGSRPLVTLPVMT